ncbi:basic helix-loop-helix (bHLH) DNA-binding superfamily protein [Abeliophyllum distichum]|uniref:Basic helix-loop-helix (BHLH) DNA-binding superfamily protein n=1 Tax=Abeliophyllum distichum TaxID=126358 RepID=A0ABD1SH00_9LAMI
MDSVYEELDEVKAEIKKLEEEYHVKADLAESLKRAQNEQLIKTQEANHKLEKLARELNGKEDKICAANQIIDDLKSNLKDKEAVIKHLTSANSKLRLDYGEKLRRCEEENKELGLALDEANAKNMDQEKQICSLKEEIEGVKRLLTVLQKKSSEAENKAKASKELKLRDDVFLKLEEKNRSFEDQLKWKNEQFGHLEEAHEKLRHHLQVREKEWEKEKAVLIDDISSLQSNLESQIRISEDLQSRLHMCNQALAHEEGKRKLLEVQLLEFKNMFDNVCDEYEEAKLKFESLTSQRDEEIATLRGSLGTTETLYKEMQYQFNKLELEKQELMVSIKELQEAQIQEAGKISSSSKLRNKLKCLEQVHRDCLMNLKAKETEWRLLNEKLKVDLNICRSALERKDISMNELKKELEDCHSLTLELELQNEENSLLLLVLKLEISEAQLRLADSSACMDLKNKEIEETNYVLVEQLELKETLVRVQKELEEEREKTVVLSRRLKSVEEDPMHKELDRLKEMLKESSSCQLHSEEQVLQIQSNLKTIHDALDRANEENSLLLLVLKSEISEVQLRLANSSACMDLKNKEIEETNSVLEEQLELKETLVRVQKELEEEREKTVFLSRRLKSIEEEQLPMHKELDRLKEMLKESSSCQLHSEEQVLQIQSNLKTIHDALDRANEENSLLLLVLKSEISEAQLRLANSSACVDLKNKEIEETNSVLVEQLELKEALVRVQKELEVEREKTVVLSRRLKSFEEEQLPMHMELEMLKESSTSQLHSEEQVLQIQSNLKTIHDALDRANEELYEKFCEVNEVEFELQIWKSIAEQFKANIKENHQLRRDVEASLLAQVEVEVNLKREKENLCHQLEEKNKRLDDLQQQIVGLNERINFKETANLAGSMTAEKEVLAKHSDEKSSEGLQKELNCLVQELMNKELEAAILAQVEKNNDQEKETLSQLVEEKDQRIYDLQQLVASLEQEFESSTCSFSLQLTKMQAERNSLCESWEKIKTAEVLKEVEIQERNLIITELEHDLSNLQQKVEEQERNLFGSRKKREEIEAELEAKQVEIYKMECELEEKKLSSDTTIKKLNDEKVKILEDFMKFLDRENLFNYTMVLLSDRIQKLSMEDMQLMKNLERIVQTMENHGPGIEMNGDDDEYDPVKENMNTFSSPLMKKAEAIHDERSPLRALNN